MQQKNNCAYCGNNPVPHFMNWYFESINVLFAPVRKVLVFNPLSRALGRLFDRVNAGAWFVKAFQAAGIVSEQTDSAACKVTRAEVLWDEAQKRGIHFSELLVFGKPFDEYKAEKNGRTVTFSGLPRPEGYNNSTLDILDDKLEFKQMMQKAGLPTPAGGSASSFRQARKIFNTIQKPVIVKPRAGSRGRHTTTFIYTEAELEKAFKVAQQLCHWVIVEEQIFGPVYRGTVINYVTEGVLRGDSPQVTGDGIHTIAQLVEKRNMSDHEGSSSIILDDKARVYLSRQNMDFAYVPEIGRVVTLSEKVGVSYGGSSSEDFTICHPDTLALFAEAAVAVADPIVGFDFIIEDITKSWKEQRCGFIEANSLPFINLHHHPRLGTPRNVAAAVWNLVGM